MATRLTSSSINRDGSSGDADGTTANRRSSERDEPERSVVHEGDPIHRPRDERGVDSSDGERSSGRDVVHSNPAHQHQSRTTASPVRTHEETLLNLSSSAKSQSRPIWRRRKGRTE